MKKNSIFLIIFLYMAAYNFISTAEIEDIRLTKHNLSANYLGLGVDDRKIKADKQNEVCVFCHTPHAATNDIPLWNRNFSTAAYSTYKPMITYMDKPGWEDHKGSFDANIEQPQGYSKLCLSCHDGTIAIGAVVNAPGSGMGSVIPGSTEEEKIQMQTRADSSHSWEAGLDITMIKGGGEYTGDTRRLGINLSNDHPISFRFDILLERIDTELVRPAPSNSTNKKDWYNASVKLYPGAFNGNFPEDFQYVQCTSCHNPHTTNTKFLRTNIYNTAQGRNDQICINCHDKPGWEGSTHQISSVEYNDNPSKTVGMVGCLNCHDTHSIQGADRLNRNGASRADGQGTPAIENTCYQCHLKNTTPVPVIGGERLVKTPSDKEIYEHFAKAPAILGTAKGGAMPLNTNWASDYEPNASNGYHQPVFVSKFWQVIDYRSSKFAEPVLFSPGTPEAVHVECVDCHNPHQVINPNEVISNDKTYLTNGGRLEGIIGITIDGYEVGRNAGGGGAINNRDPFVHEVCLRCHGDSVDKVMPYVALGTEEANQIGMDPNRIRNRGHYEKGYVPAGDKLLYQRGYSNKRTEFDPKSIPMTRKYDGTRDQYNASKLPEDSRNTAFHPVNVPGRNGSVALCKQLETAFNLDCSSTESARVSLTNLTINCTDCHNNEDTANYRGPVTESNLRSTNKPTKYLGSQAIGPHGSTNYRVLRATYVTTGYPNSSTGLPSDRATDEGASGGAEYFAALCFLCHDKSPFVGGADCSRNTNFGGGACYSAPPGIGEQWNQNLHYYHLTFSNAKVVCHDCHNNVHSNVEANNTIYGDGNGGGLPPDDMDGIIDGVSDTHLLNFAPNVGGKDSLNPRWFYDGEYHMCNLKCHGTNMSSCGYKHGGPTQGSCKLGT